MRTITDSAGVQWTVFEVKGQVGSRERLSYLPQEFGDGWLCFESEIGKRRLTPVPARWREFSDAELERLLGQAQPANRVRLGAEDRRSDRA
jgi:hypothetical protein